MGRWKSYPYRALIGGAGPPATPVGKGVALQTPVLPLVASALLFPQHARSTRVAPEADSTLRVQLVRPLSSPSHQVPSGSWWVMLQTVRVPQQQLIQGCPFGSPVRFLSLTSSAIKKRKHSLSLTYRTAVDDPQVTLLFTMRRLGHAMLWVLWLVLLAKQTAGSSSYDATVCDQKTYTSSSDSFICQYPIISFICVQHNSL